MKNYWSIGKITGAISFITLYGYIVAYAYEVGYLSYFDLPDFLVRIGIESIVRSSVITTYVILTIYVSLKIFVFFFSSLSSSERETNHTRESIYLSAIILILNIPFVVAIAQNTLDIAIFSGLILFAYFLIFIFLSIFVENLSPNNIKAIYVMGKSLDFFKFEKKIFSKTQIVIVFFLIILILYSVVLSKLLGRSGASRESEFLTFSSNEETYIIVRKYEDRFIAVNINKENRTLNNKYMLIASGIELRGETKTIGPIRNAGEFSISRYFENLVSKLLRT